MTVVGSNVMRWRLMELKKGPSRDKMFNICALVMVLETCCSALEIVRSTTTITT